MSEELFEPTPLMKRLTDADDSLERVIGGGDLRGLLAIQNTPRQAHDFIKAIIYLTNLEGVGYVE